MKAMVAVAARGAGAKRRAALCVFALVALAIVVCDQLLKSWIVGNFKLDTPYQVVGDWLQIDFIHNAGGLFGLFQNSAGLFALVSVGVVVAIIGFEYRSGWTNGLVTLALALLLGGAIGNFIDRIRLGYVVDFADLGIGTWRWYIFNVADSAVTVAIGVLLLVSIFAPPALGIRPDRPEDEAAAKPQGADDSVGDEAAG
jgi:signal peptidase II